MFKIYSSVNTNWDNNQNTCKHILDKRDGSYLQWECLPTFTIINIFQYTVKCFQLVHYQRFTVTNIVIYTYIYNYILNLTVIYWKIGCKCIVFVMIMYCECVMKIRYENFRKSKNWKINMQTRNKDVLIMKEYTHTN